MLKNLSKVVVQYCVTSHTSRSAREFYRQCRTKKNALSNPECEVREAIRSDGAPSMVKVEFAGGGSDIFKVDHINVRQILERIGNRSKDMELKKMFKEAGVADGFTIDAVKPYLNKARK